MELAVVKHQIQQKDLSNLYIFTGDELEVMTRYVHKIAEIVDKPLHRIEFVSDMYKAKSSSLFAQSFCYVCRDDEAFIKSEKAWESIFNVLGDNILILEYSKIDKRGKFYKQFEDRIVSFDYLQKELLMKYIRKDIKLSDLYADDLVEVCEYSYSAILMEIDKLKQYKQSCGDDSLSYDQCYQKLIADGTIHQPPRDAIFMFVDAVLMGKPRKSYALLQECLELGEPALRLLLVLHTNIKHLLQVQSCESNDVSKSTGLTNWEIKNVLNKCDIYSNSELVRALRNIQTVEKRLKTGQIDEFLAVDYILINLF